MVKSLPAILETGVQTLGWEDALEKIPWRRAWQPTPIFLPGECHGQRSLVSYTPWGHKESDTTEWLTHTVLEQGFLGGTRGKNLPANAGNIRDMGSIPGLGRSPREGHGNPLQYSCLENPQNRGTWWATVHRIAKSQTRLKLLSTQHSSVGAMEWTRYLQVSQFPFCFGVICLLLSLLNKEFEWCLLLSNNKNGNYDWEENVAFL